VVVSALALGAMSRQTREEAAHQSDRAGEDLLLYPVVKPKCDEAKD
jgi:hypothetical protein